MMSGLRRWLVFFTLFLGPVVVHGRADDPDSRKLAAEAYAVLEKYCAECHSGADPKSDKPLQVLDHAKLTGKAEDLPEPFQFYVQAGEKGEKALKASYLWKRGGLKGVAGAQQNMPPKKFNGKVLSDDQFPSDKQRAVLQRWIEAGAPREGFGKADKPPAPGTASSAREEAEDLSLGALAVLKKACAGCHHGKNPKEDGEPFHVRKYADLIRKRGEGDGYYLVKPGLEGAEELKQSELWRRVKTGDMPRSGVLAAPEKALLEKWIAAGAPAPPPPSTRAFKTEAAVLRDIRADLEKTSPEDRPYRRYFTLTALHNDRRIPDRHLPPARAAVSKLINSLTWSAEIVVPQPIDSDGVTFAIDLRRLGWHRHGLWDELLRQYPYGIAHPPDSPPGKLAEEIATLSGSPQAYVRGDWFIRTASRPPLYDAFLRLPQSGRDLEARLGVAFEDAFMKPGSEESPRLLRAGYFTATTTTSGIRMVERVRREAPGADPSAYYWRSYDFGEVAPRSNLLRYPLGPRFPGNPFADQAFEHQGSEIIFSLPNGLQGYLVTDQKDRSRPVAPRDVLKDLSQTGGDPAIVNGISCMGCHVHGMHLPLDQVREGMRLGGEVEARVRALYPPQEKITEQITADRKRFLRGLVRATGRFLDLPGWDQAEIGIEAFKRLERLSEPIRTLVLRHEEDVDLTQAALELGFEREEDLARALSGKQDGELLAQKLGLGALLQETALPRAVWSAAARGSSVSASGASLFQEAARALGLGAPNRLPERPPPVPPANLRAALAELAAELAALLDDFGEEAVSLRITDAGRGGMEAAPGLAFVLGQELAQSRKKPRANARLTLHCEYDVSEVWSRLQPGVKRPAVWLRAQLRDLSGYELVSFRFERVLESDEALVQLYGLTVELPPPGKPAERAERIGQGVRKPAGHVRKEGVLAAGPSSPYGVEILAGPRDATQPVRSRNGLPIVDLKPGESYAVRLTNESDQEVAARLFIDGLSLFEFSQSRTKEGTVLSDLVLIPAKGSVVIRGWHRNRAESYTFLVARFPESTPWQQRYALGSITAAFSPVWSAGEKPPPGEVAPRTEVAAWEAERSKAVGTVPGRVVETSYREHRRVVGSVRAAVTVRYAN